MPQQVLPTFVVVIGGGQRGGPELGDFDLARLLHAEQSVTVHGALPTSATVRSRGRLPGFYDKGADALIVMESETTDVGTGQLIAESRTSVFVRGEGGFTGRALLHAACGSDPARFHRMKARFSAPVRPGQVLDVHIWDEGDVCLFQTKVGDTVVLDRGVFQPKGT